jgi:hypothetical protein
MVPLTPTKFVMANQTAREDAREPNFSTASRKGEKDSGFFGSVVAVAFQIAFRVKIHVN